MGDAPWSGFMRVVEYDDGLPNGVVEGTNLSDWQAVLTLVRVRAIRYEFSYGRQTELPENAARLFEDPESLPTFHVWLDKEVMVNFFPFTPDSIDFDVDARELTTQAAVEPLLLFIVELGTTCRKVVRLTEEGQDEVTLMTFDASSNTFTFHDEAHTPDVPHEPL